MSRRGDRVLRDVHRLATIYHWSRAEILSLTLPRRLQHLTLIESEEDAQLFSALDQEGEERG
jgi:hypothetical protein